jgi:hypothetical protein
LFDEVFDGLSLAVRKLPPHPSPSSETVPVAILPLQSLQSESRPRQSPRQRPKSESGPQAELLEESLICFGSSPSSCCQEVLILIQRILVPVLSQRILVPVLSQRILVRVPHSVRNLKQDILFILSNCQ